MVTDIFDFDDLLDAHELLTVKNINEERAQRAAEREAEMQKGG